MQRNARHPIGAGFRVALAGSLLACGGVALAQTAPPPAQDGAASTATIPVAELPPADAAPPPQEAVKEKPDAVRLDDIVVTATKRKRNLRDIPASIAAFDGKKLESQGKVGLLDYLEETPGVTADTVAPGVTRISMRGISTDTAPASGAPPPTGIFIGDTAFSDPYVNSIVPDLSAFDLASVEILKGPQGTLFGGTALSGAVRFILQDPVMGQWQGRAFTQYTDVAHGANAFTSGAAVNAPIYEDKLAFRGVYVKRGYPGLNDNVRQPVQKDIDGGGGDQVRGILSWKPTEEIGVKLTHLDQDFHGDNVSSNTDNPRRYEKSRALLPQPVDNKFALDSLELGYQFENARVVSLTSRSTKHLYFSTDLTSAVAGPPPPGYPEQAAVYGYTLDDSKAWAQEVRLQSTGNGSFQWLAGAYYYDYHVYFEQLFDSLAKDQLLGSGSPLNRLLTSLGIDIGLDDLSNQTSLLFAVADVTAVEKALFFDASQKLWDKLELSAGGRLYSTTVKGGFNAVGILPRAQNNGMDINNDDSRLTERGFSPKLAATWRFDRDNSIYALVSRGFRFGGIQSAPSTPTNGVPEVYKSDIVWNYELGLRTTHLNRTLQLDVTGFFIDYKNPQVAQSTQGIPIGYTDNVASAVSKGFEASVRWRTPIPSLIWSLSGGVTDAHTTAPFESSDGTVIPAGTQLPGAAITQLATGLNMALPVGRAIVAPRLDYLFLGSGYGDINHGYEINNFGTLSAGLGILGKNVPGRPMLALNVSNILGITRVKGGAPATSITGTRYESYLLNSPRTFTARLSLDF